tara:strand:- start:4436 stop:5014 length:579 start_codon:yes stop_codon:yes gene_type:complete
MRQVWPYEEWKDIEIGKMREAFIKRSRTSPRLGDIKVIDLCCLACNNVSPVGIYVFTRDADILYVGKTHGRSLQERMISHVDNRKPSKGSPHLASLVSTLVKSGGSSDESDAVFHILNMKVTWLPVPTERLAPDLLKKSIAVIERRLLWQECLDPTYNSTRVKRNNSFTVKGKRYHLSEVDAVGELVKNETI